MNWKIVSWESIKGGTMRYLKPLRPFFAWSQLSIPTVYDDSLSYYEVLNKCIFHFNEMLKIMQENYEIIDEAFAKILEECEAAIARCEEAAARAEAAQSAAEKAQAAAEAAQAAAEAAQKLAEAAQAAAEAARDDAVTAQKAAEAAQAAAEAAQAAAEAAQKKAETAQAAAEAAQAKAEDAQEKAESARDAAQASQTAAEAAQQKAEAAQTAAESARDTAQAAQAAAESARDAAQAAQASAESARDAALEAAEEIKKALDNYYDKTESDATFVKKAGDTMTGNLVMDTKDDPNNGTVYLDGAATRFRTIYLTGNQDFNNLLLNGIYCRARVTEGDKNYPSTLDGSNFILIVIAGTSAKIVKQIFFSYNVTQDIYIRFSDLRESEINFGSWEKISTLSDISGNYLPLSGGTMTGKINVQDEWTDTFTGLSKGNYATIINENSDLNDVKTNCINFYPTSVVTSEESKNFPTKSSGFLVSLCRDSLTYIRQIYYVTIYNDIYTRIYNSNSSSWSNWGKIATTAEINNSLSGYLPLTGGTMTGKINVADELNDTFTGLSKGNYVTTINENSDLNNVKTNSINFYPPKVAISEESKNFPVKISGFLVSIVKDESTYIRQIYYATPYNDIYTRIYNSSSNSWSNWDKILFETDIAGNYLPLSGGTMAGNITMSNNAELVGNASTSDFLKLIQIPDNSDMNKIIESGFYAITNGDSVSNAPEEISAENNAFSCFVFPWQYQNTAGISQLIFSGDGTTVKGVYLRLTNNPEVGWGDWVRLDNVNNDNNDNDNIIMSTSSNFRYRIKNYENNFQHIEMWISQATLTGRAISPNKVLTESYSMKIGDDILDLININFNHSATIVPIQTSNDNVRGFCYTLIENDNLVFYSTFISNSTNDESFSYYFYNCKVVDLVDNRKP